MDKQKIIIVITGLILLAGIVWIVIAISQGSSNTEKITGTEAPITSDPDETSETPNTRTPAELNDAIIDQIPALVKDGEPNFAVVNVKQVDERWYAVKVYNTVDPSIGNAWIIFKDQGEANGGLIPVAGPGTSFPPSTPIPESVRKAIK